MANPLSKIDDVAWKDLSHAYGSAVDVPEMLRAFAFGSREQREIAFEGWWGTIIHQGTYYPATVAVIPFLVEIAFSSETADRYEIIDELQGIGRGWIDARTGWRPRPYFTRYANAQKRRHDDSAFVQAAFESVNRYAQEFCAAMLLDDQPPNDAIATAFLLSILVQHPRLALLTLLQAYDHQKPSHVRAQILIAIKELLANCESCNLPTVDLVEAIMPRMRAVSNDHDSNLSEDVQTAASLVLLQFGDSTDELPALERLRTACERDDPFLECRSNPHSWNLAWMINGALENKPHIRRTWITRQIGTTVHERLKDYIRLATSYCERYRLGPDTFVPELVKRLADAQGEHRESILYALSGLGGQGLAELERLATEQNDELAATKLEMFRNNWKSSLIRELDVLPAPSIVMNDRLAEVTQFLEKDHLPTRIRAIREYLALTGDRLKTAELAASAWRPDFVALQLLEIIGECGSVAADLVPELKLLINSEERCVSAGWLQGICSLDEAIAELAKRAISRIEAPTG